MASAYAGFSKCYGEDKWQIDRPLFERHSSYMGVRKVFTAGTARRCDFRIDFLTSSKCHWVCFLITFSDLRMWSLRTPSASPRPEQWGLSSDEVAKSSISFFALSIWIDSSIGSNLVKVRSHCMRNSVVKLWTLAAITIRDHWKAGINRTYKLSFHLCTFPFVSVQSPLRRFAHLWVPQCILPNVLTVPGAFCAAVFSAKLILEYRSSRTSVFILFEVLWPNSSNF
jgi:hypothetical protein